MTNVEFIKYMKDLIDKFEAEQNMCNQKDPEHWPNNMTLGEWIEQFTCFQELQNEY